MPRLLFEKVGPAVFISHLDLMRVFQRAFRRAGLLIKHSQGYSPRAHVAIALPLSVGAESICELLDFELAEGVKFPLEQIPQALNRTMPQGIRVKEIWETGRKLRDLTHLDGEVTLTYDGGNARALAESVAAFFQKPDPILISKTNKAGKEVEVDIRPMILGLQVQATDEHHLVLKARVCAQNPSLNPALLGTALSLYLPDAAPDFVQVRRLEVLDPEGVTFR